MNHKKLSTFAPDKPLPPATCSWGGCLESAGGMLKRTVVGGHGGHMESVGGERSRPKG